MGAEGVPIGAVTLFLFHKKLFCFAKTFTKNTRFFGKAFFSKEKVCAKRKKTDVTIMTTKIGIIAIRSDVEEHEFKE